MSEMQEKYCSQCGTEVEPWTVVCSKFGHILLETPDPSTVITPSTVSPEIRFKPHSMEKCPKCQSSDIYSNQPLHAGDLKVTIILGQLTASLFGDCCRTCGYVELHLDETDLQSLQN
ncbi:MAG: hypothetical protein ACFFDT_35005 [Candidatus Hodarchaeota archaeon]